MKEKKKMEKNSEKKTSAFSSNETQVVERKIKLGEDLPIETIKSFEERFEIKETIKFLIEGKYKSVTLQF